VRIDDGAFLAPLQLRMGAIAQTCLYRGARNLHRADRERLPYAGAKAEGKVTWYTSLAGGSYKAMVKAFETKYPGVKVEVYRVSGSDITVRMMEEAKTKRYTAAIPSQPPHPHGALLLADYLLGPEGQAVLEKFEYGSATKHLARLQTLAPGSRNSYGQI
jgi:ABC-type glycerol-3-phosphate transport system substrate-binding protein